MLSKRVLDALREQFHEEFGELSERDSYIKRMKGRCLCADRQHDTQRQAVAV